MSRSNSFAERFEQKVYRCPMSGCWLWTGATRSNGYGWLWIPPKRTFAHRISWELHRGVIPQGMSVLHHCDTPLCCNPYHLFIGDVTANMTDAKRKGRLAFGERVGTSKLTHDAVKEIRKRRASGAIQQRLADEFGVTQTLISAICRRTIWKHI